MEDNNPPKVLFESSYNENRLHKTKGANTYPYDVLFVNKFDENDYLDMALERMPLWLKIINVTLIWISLFFGSFFKYVLYRYILHKNKANRGWMHRPINVLTASSAMIQHVTHIWTVSWYSIIYLDMVGTPISAALGDHWCQIVQTVCLYGMFWANVGSLGIAVYRLMYIKYEEWVKYTIGEELLLFIVMTSNLTMNELAVYLYDLEVGKHRIQMNMCRGILPNQAQVLIDYRISIGENLITTTHFQKLALWILITYQISEFSIYIWVFYIRYKNDNKTSIKKALTEDIIKARNVKNATNFLGQFYGFMTEYVFLAAILFIIAFEGQKSSNFKGYAMTAKFMDFGLLSAMEVFTSPTLRSFMKREVRYICKKFGKYFGKKLFKVLANQNVYFKYFYFYLLRFSERRYIR